MLRLQRAEDLAAAVERLTAAEPRFATVVARHGLPPLRHADPGLKSLLRIVTDQLISLRAGQAIWARLAERLGDFAPGTVLAVPEQALRELGLSGAKARTFHAAALAFSEGHFAGADHLSEQAFLDRLTAIPGVGPWTATLYLLTVLRSADSWPAADLALQVAAQDLLGLPGRPSTREMNSMAEAWRPDRTAAALLLWSHYRGLKAIPQG